MTSTQAFRRAHRIAIVLAVLFIGIAPPCFAQATTPPGGPDESVSVHGEWIIVVRNPDGTVVSRHEFRNGLSPAPGGGALLTQLLARSIAPGKWVVRLDNGGVGATCNANGASCGIAQPGTGFFWNSTDLTVTVPTAGANAGKLVLSGSLRIPRDTVLGDVSTQFLTCPPSGVPSSCTGALGSGFTVKALNPVIPVVTDQIVDVTVVISFS
jgi:hypothetical protein